MFLILPYLGIDNRHIGNRPVGDKHLVSVQYITVSTFFCPCGDGGYIRARSRLGESHASDPLAGSQFGNIFFSLGVRSMGKDGIGA